jgi:hypothetical protein
VVPPVATTPPVATAPPLATPTKKAVATTSPTPATTPEATPAAPVDTPAETVTAAPAKPALRVQAPSSGRVGEALTFTATLPDAGWTVKVYFRPSSGGPFDNKAMTAANGSYTASVKVTEAMAGGVSWFVSATKGSNTLKEGSPTSARTITIAP